MKLQLTLSLSMGEYVKRIEREQELTLDETFGIEPAFDFLPEITAEVKTAMNACYDAIIAAEKLKEAGVKRFPDFGDVGG